MRLVFGTFIFLVIVFAVIEFQRWTRPAYVASLPKGSQGRRVVGTLLLVSVGAMCYAGTYLPDPKHGASSLQQAWMMIYWGICMLLAVAIPVVGYLEFKQTMLQMNRELTAAYRETLLGEKSEAQDGATPDE
ncbi:MAG TPA: hypothetical protein VGK19_25465 [Capsulimonadaceae bacterium]|jgi:hypothetical protein